MRGELDGASHRFRIWRRRCSTKSSSLSFRRPSSGSDGTRNSQSYVLAGINLGRNKKKAGEERLIYVITRYSEISSDRVAATLVELLRMKMDEDRNCSNLMNFFLYLLY